MALCDDEDGRLLPTTVSSSVCALQEHVRRQLAPVRGGLGPHMQRRIVIDFDADDSAAATAAPARTLSTPAVAAEAASAGNGKPADMLRAIQSMRLTLKRLEQQKVAAGGGGGAAPTLDKQAALLAQARGLAWDTHCSLSLPRCQAGNQNSAVGEASACLGPGVMQRPWETPCVAAAPLPADGAPAGGD